MASRRAGFSMHLGASAFLPEGELWEDNEFDFGTETGDLAALRWGAEFHYAVHPRVDLFAGVDLGKRNFPSVYIDYVFEDGSEIQHSTEYSFTDLILGVRVRPGPPRSRFSPWLQGGFSGSFYRYDEYGDFVDFGTPNQDIVYDAYQESSFLYGFFTGVGADYRFAPNWSLYGEWRLNYAGARHQDDFADYGDFKAWRTGGVMGLRLLF